MGLLGRTRRGLALTKDSIVLTKNHPRLLVFPLVAGAAAVVFYAVLAGVTFGFAVTGSVESLARNEVAVLGVLFVVYFVTTFISSFFTGALVHEVKEVVEGGEPEFRRGLEAAWRVKEKLVAWAAISATVGVVLRIAESSDSRGGQLLSLIFGVAWTLMTFFIVPTAVLKPEESVREMFRESASTFRSLWGETPIGIVGPNLVALPIYAVGAGVAFVLLNVSFVVAVLAALLFFAAGTLVAAALRGVVKTALYVYAVDGRMPREFEGEDIEGLTEV